MNDLETHPKTRDDFFFALCFVKNKIRSVDPVARLFEHVQRAQADRIMRRDQTSVEGKKENSSTVKRVRDVQ